MEWPSSPTLPIHLILPQVAFFCCFTMWKKVLEGKHSADVEEVKQKMAKALKDININEFKNCFEQWKKHPNIYIASSREYFEDDKFKHVRINQIVYK